MNYRIRQTITNMVVDTKLGIYWNTDTCRPTLNIRTKRLRFVYTHNWAVPLLAMPILCCVLASCMLYTSRLYCTRILYQTLPVHSYFLILFESSTLLSQQSAATPPLSRIYTSSYTSTIYTKTIHVTTHNKSRDYTCPPSLSPESVCQIKNCNRERGIVAC